MSEPLTVPEAPADDAEAIEPPRQHFNLPYQVGQIDSRVSVVEQRLAKHEVQISALEQGDAAMMSKLAQNDERWQQVAEKLQIVDQIQDIHTTIRTVGKMMSTIARAIKYCVVTTAICSGIYVSIHTGDLNSLLQFIQTLIGYNG